MRKGSITIYVSLVLCVILSLIYAAMDSARYSCGRAMISLAAEEGLFSLFGEYDRLLYDNYGLLLIDGGYEGSDLKAGALLEEAEDYMKRVLYLNEDGVSYLSPNPFGIDIDGAAVTGYVLATDSGGEMIRRQICELMIEKTGIEGLGSLVDYFTDSASVLEAAEADDLNRMDRLKAEYEARKKEAEEKKEESDDGSQAKEAPKLPEDFENPIDSIYKLKKLGVLAAVVPEGRAISSETVEKSRMPSERNLGGGFGLLPKEEAGITDAFLLAKYITDYFPAFTDDVDQEGFLYQAEYAVAGKNTDVENLRSVLNRLLLMRESLNFTYLLSDPEKREEAETLALTITSALMLPELFPLATVLLLLCWAFGESLLDLKTLLADGKVPLVKDSESFRLSLSELAHLSEISVLDNAETGFTYKEYLCILLMLKGGKKLMEAVLDLLEYNRRRIAGEPSFSIDTGVCSLEMQIEGCIGKHAFLLTRSYGYDL